MRAPRSWRRLAFAAFVGVLMRDNRADAAVTPASPFQVGAPTLVYDTGRDGCDIEDVPDAPARAFRDASGTIHFFAASTVDRAMLGRSFHALKRACAIVLNSSKDPDPSHYADFEWLTGFYIEGRTVHALVHNEYHGWLTPERCPSQKVANCWQNAITPAISHDEGRHFRLLSGPHPLVAALPDRFDPTMPNLVGYFNPTNIIKVGGQYYAMATAITNNDPDHAGICIMRTSDLSNPSSWRGWDGHSFTITFVDPYTENTTPRAAHVCVPVGGNGFLPFALGSLLQVPSRHMFVLLTRSQIWDVAGSGRAPGAYLSVSRDMITWSKPQLLLSDAAAAGHAGDEKPGRGDDGWRLFSREVHLDLAALETSLP